METTVYDSSGYSNNGTITGTLTAAAGSPRYDVATVFNGSSYTSTSNLTTANPSSASLWVKFNSLGN